MREIEIGSTEGEKILNCLKQRINGELSSEWGEHTLAFSNNWGNGNIRCIEFDWGISLMNFNVFFNEDVKFVFNLKDESPVEFIFISEGTIRLGMEERKCIGLDRYQNVIISPKKYSRKEYFFSKKVRTKINFISILKEKYAEKKNNNLRSLNEIISPLFDNESKNTFAHIGNYNLKIADEVQQLFNSQESGIARTLSLEGRLYLILAMQITEFRNFESQLAIPESLSKEDIGKIHNLSEYIIENISEPLTVTDLSLESGLSPKKLQLGFKVLYSKSVNEYVRLNKLGIARDHLRNTDLSISEIVYRIGFKSRSYFSKIFTDKYGMLPTEYRKKLKNIR